MSEKQSLSDIEQNASEADEQTSEIDTEAVIEEETFFPPDLTDTDHQQSIVGLDTTGMYSVTEPDGATEELSDDDTQKTKVDGDSTQLGATAQLEIELNDTQSLSDDQVGADTVADAAHGFNSFSSDEVTSARNHAWLTQEEPARPDFEDNSTSYNLAAVEYYQTPQEKKDHENQVQWLRVIFQTLENISKRPPGQKKQKIGPYEFTILNRNHTDDVDQEFMIIVHEQKDGKLVEKAHKSVTVKWTDFAPLKVITWKNNTDGDSAGAFVVNGDVREFLVSLLHW